MSLCRVYERADGTVAVVHPAPKSRRTGESEKDWYARVMAKAAETNPELAGLPFHDCDAVDLPARKDRKDWRVRSGKVAVERPDA